LYLKEGRKEGRLSRKEYERKEDRRRKKVKRR